MQDVFSLGSPKKTLNSDITDENGCSCNEWRQLWPGLPVHGFLPGAGQQGTDLQLQCWPLLHIFLGHQGKRLDDIVKEEEESINPKKEFQDRRRAEFLAKKNGPLPERELSVEKETAPENIFQCDQCKNNFKSENGLKIHIGKTHKKVDSTLATPECPRQQSRSSVSLSASPLLDTSREESSTTSPEPAEQCRKCFSKPPLCICTEHFCKECCLEANHLFRVHSYRWTYNCDLKANYGPGSQLSACF